MASAGPSPLPSQFDQALSLHQQGQLQAASALYQAILDQDPAHFDALHLRGVIAAQTGDAAGALALIDRALAVDGAHAVVHYNRALALRDLGRLSEALAGLATALALAPAYTEAWISQAETLLALQRPDDALESYSRALALAPADLQALLARAALLQNLQRPAAALAEFDRVLALDPDSAGALQGRALALQALDRTDEAVQAYDRLLRGSPANAAAHHGRGKALEQLNQPEAALAAYARALALQPDLADARLRRGRLLRGLGRQEQALAEYEALLGIAPAHAEALFEVGSIQQALGRHADALQSYDRALAARPALAEACINRALVLLALQRPAEAVAACERAIAINPKIAEAHANLGLALSTLPGQLAQALDCYDRALALRPDYAEAHANRGHLLQQQRQFDAALAAYERALALAPRQAEYLYGQGAVLHLLGRGEDALASYDRALAMAPGHLLSLFNRGGLLLKMRRHAQAADNYARLLRVAPEHPYALGNRLHAQLHLCDWSDYAASCAALGQAVAQGRQADMPFSHLAVSDSPAAQLQCARTHATAHHVAAAALWRGQVYAHQRTRVAYVSGDLRSHAVSYLLAELLELHDRSRFELTAIALHPPEASGFGARIQGAFEHFIDASALDDLEVARLIASRQIDLAIDLMGYTEPPRHGIFAHRPAPVQAAYLGYAGTLGTGYMDYLIADAVVIPPQAQQFYAEQVVRLPHTLMPRDRTTLPAAAPSRLEVGLPLEGLVFCCFNNAYKLNPPVFDIWMRLLRAAPGSVLWLTDPGPQAADNLRREAHGRGVDPARLVFAARTAELAEHLGRLALADLFLDTLPYNAHTTASDALWAGLPLLTCAGAAFASRVAASLLTAAGLPELITTSLAQYEAVALRLAHDPAELAALRVRLAAARGNAPVFDTPGLCRALENAYSGMVERSRRGEAPAAFTVAP